MHPVVALLDMQGKRVAVGTKETGQGLEGLGFLVLLAAIVVKAVVVAVATTNGTAIAGAVVGNQG